MSALTDSPLDVQRALVADLRAQLTREELILEGMERMVAFSAPKPPVAQAKRPPANKTGGSRGRQPGAISKRWRTVFKYLVALGNYFDDDAVVTAVQRIENRPMRRSEVRRLFETHRANDLVVFNDDGTYSVTGFAIEKFALDHNESDTRDLDENDLLGDPPQKQDEPRSVSAGGPYHGRMEAEPFRRPWEIHPTVQG